MRLPKIFARRPHLVGPLFRFELVRLARGGRLIWLRALYALAILGLVWLVFRGWTPVLGRFYPTPEDLQFEPGRLAEEFTQSLLVTQNIVVLVLAPLYLGTAITEERTRRTLELLRTTHLSGREIILGKWLARSLILAAVVLAGLPILALVHFLGGVNLWLVLGGFAITGITILQAGAVSIYCSVR